MHRIISYNEKRWLYAKNEKFSLIYIVIFHNKPEFFIISHFLLDDLLLSILIKTLLGADNGTMPSKSKV